MGRRVWERLSVNGGGGKRKGGGCICLLGCAVPDTGCWCVEKMGGHDFFTESNRQEVLQWGWVYTLHKPTPEEMVISFGV